MKPISYFFFLLCEVTPQNTRYYRKMEITKDYTEFKPCTRFPPGLVFLPRPLTYLLSLASPSPPPFHSLVGEESFPSTSHPISLRPYDASQGMPLSLSLPPLLLFGAFFYSGEVLQFPQLNPCLIFSSESTERYSTKYFTTQ